MDVLFWTALSALAYAFVGYPALLKAFNAVFGRKGVARDSRLPSVSVIVSAFNEEAVIEDKIRNFLALDYPHDRLELLVISDGSTDRTEAIVTACESDRVRLLVQESNMGKTAALNRAADESDSDLLVFTDANSMFDSDAVLKLAARFSDPEVGLVSGHTVYVSPDGGTSSGGAYRRYEDWMKEQESSLWGIVGADGAIYAMRRCLYKPMLPEHINDFLHPIQAVMAGSRAVQEQSAICREPQETVGPGELKRQTRIMTQSWIIVCSQFVALTKSGRIGFLWQLLSHKVLRWLTLPLLGCVLFSNLFLFGQGRLYSLALFAQAVFYLAAYAFRKADGGIKQLPYSFLLLHLSAVIGFVQYMKGEKYISWKPRNN